MSLDRRLFLGGVTASVMTLRAAAQGAAPSAATAPGSGSETPHAGSLPLDKTAAADGFRTLEARVGTIRLLPQPAAATSAWCYEGQVPGPLLRIKHGGEVMVRLVNRLDEPTSLCWHGVRIANAMDGVVGLTQAPVAPGAHFDYRFTPPDCGLFWYHPHVWPLSAAQIGRGLYGLLIVDEADPPACDAEMLVVLDDWSLDDKGVIRGDFLNADQAFHAGRIGALITTNTMPVPTTTTLKPGSRVRLRVLSVMSARIMFVGFEGAHPMVQAIDGQPCELFEPVRQTIPVGPGARFDIMIDLPREAGREARLVLRGEGSEPDRPLLILKTMGAVLAARDAIAVLPQNPALPPAIPLERAFKMDLVIEGGAKPSPSATAAQPAPAARLEPPSRRGRHAGQRRIVSPPAPPPPPFSSPDPTHLWAINGVSSDGFSGKPLFSVNRGTAVSLAFVNKSAFAQQIHIHGHVMRLLHDLDDGWEPYWRDAVLVADNHTKHVAFIADNPGKWAIESLILDRQDTGLAGWFLVT